MKNSLKKSNATGAIPAPAAFKQADKDDLKALALVKKGNARAFAHIVHKYEDVLMVKIVNVVRDEDQAKDILQDIFAKVFTNIGRYEKRFTFNAWLTSVANNHLVDVIRKKKHAKEINESTIQGILSDESGSFDMRNFADDTAHQFDEESYEDKHELQYSKIESIIKSFDQEDQALITLFYLERKRQREICDILNITHSAIRVRLLRLKSRLKKLAVVRGESQVSVAV